MSDNISPQYFSFPNPLIDYLCHNSTSMKKLYKTCKYFYSKYQLCIVEFVGVYVIGVGDAINENDRLFKNKPMYLKWLQFYGPEIDFLNYRLWVTKHLFINDVASKVVSKIAKCDIYDLSIACKITYAELKFLTQSGNVTELKFWPVTISHDDVIPLEDVFE
uniref:Uncharacterized protein n=1 Tax=Panagrolaimus sp. ES5 TaxID=591445 RepID=A0AC34GUF0_9BILA